MVDAVTSADAAGRLTSSRSSLVSNFETFLQLLTAQLKNQDPLSPLDSNEFTAQLTQMAGVEQQLLTNDLLTSLLSQNEGGLGPAASYLGQDVTAAWAATRFEDGTANWNYELGANAAEVTLSVVNSAGNTLWSGPAPETEAGLHSFSWDGKTSAGGQVAEGGVYTLKVTAKTASGQDIDAQALITGRVTGVELYEGEPYLVVGSSVLPLTAVFALSQAETASNNGGNANTNTPTQTQSNAS
ncbi:MAG TPA: flagellar hook capping FlgD N-terminal domain-containing protein [Brevundimonas sp.]|jgi:flagellar basal-body rod modification protein FlgD|uniref:flagellar hook assembly protein FlgD n=1 Tax=Brevundimonas sp. TaxID=1871086 RepID=UPI002E120022|nr:flagellar hook capping FlgD N-terminal domain-containing protein [Brevundimonas sp.]